jgi:hypothetical protein
VENDSPLISLYHLTTYPVNPKRKTLVFLVSTPLSPLFHGKRGNEPQAFHTSIRGYYVEFYAKGVEVLKSAFFIPHLKTLGRC